MPSLKGIATTIAGVVLSAVPGGQFLGPGLIAAGTAMNQADTSKKAAKEQSDAADKAIATQKEQFEQGRADLAPWRNVGAGAVGTLGAVMGVPMGGGAPMAPAAGAAGPGGPGTGSRRPFTGQPVGHAQPRPAPSIPTRPGSNPKLEHVRRLQRGAQTQSASSLVPAAQSGGAMVRVKAPTGQVVIVPRERVDEAVQNGGQVVA